MSNYSFNEKCEDFLLLGLCCNGKDNIKWTLIKTDLRDWTRVGH